MKSFFTKEVLGHPLVLAAIAGVVVIAVGSGVYYLMSTAAPAVAWEQVTRGSITEVVTASGTVEPAQNPNLAFESSGRVARVSVVVGQTVSAGQTLASLDLGTLSATREQAVANLAAASAKLAGLEAPTRQTDLTVKQTAVAQAQQSLANTYTNAQVALANARDQISTALHNNTDTLFSQPNSTNPTIAFQSTNNQIVINTITARAALNTQIATWGTAIDALSPASSPADTETAITNSLTVLVSVRDYSSQLLGALANAVPSATFPQSAINAAQVAVQGLNTNTNAQIATLQGQQQQIAAATLAVQSAQGALTQTSAGASTQDIQAAQASVQAAQASIDSVDAQIRNAIIVAPFTGTVGSVAIKTGQTVSAGAASISLMPESALQVTIYLSEVDAAHVHTGDMASVTLDALGGSRVFHATIVSLDTSPSSDPSNNTSGPAYKTTLQFASNDPAIVSGMTANATIVAAQKADTLIVPKSAVITNSDRSFVLIHGANGPTQQLITTGIESTSTVEVLSGLTEGESFLVTAH